jgi:hypothetical protein
MHFWSKWSLSAVAIFFASIVSYTGVLLLLRSHNSDAPTRGAHDDHAHDDHGPRGAGRAEESRYFSGAIHLVESDAVGDAVVAAFKVSS